VKDILRVKEMDPNSWTVQVVGDIAIRLEKAQGEETLWTTTKPVVVPSGVFGESGFVKTQSLRVLDADDQVIFRRSVRIKPVNPRRKPLQTHVPTLQTQKLIGPRILSAYIIGQVTLQRVARRVRPLAIEPHNKKESLGV
jgi:hypothetical protein